MMTTTTCKRETVWKINIVNENDLVDLLPLLRDYCQFYNQTEDISQPNDEVILFVSKALIENPKNEGIQLIVRHAENGKAVGFATLLWSWSMLAGGRLAIMEDLFVDQSSRGQGIADLLIGECERCAREQGASCLTWQTSVKNHRAQTFYDRCGAMKSNRWLNYTRSL